MEERKTKFTALGRSFSGKTCYILGMYYKMSAGDMDWTLLTENSTADKLVRWAEKLDNEEEGRERFPKGTFIEERTNYQFGLYYNNRHLIMNFEWIDYAGDLFNHTGTADFVPVEQSIASSSAIYVFIDGEDLCCDEQKKRIRNVRNKCSRYIQPFITKFMVAHEGKIPPVIFVVTKLDLCRKYMNGDEATEQIKDIIKESFSSLYCDPDAKIYLTAVSLGKNISDDDYKGDIEPLNIHIPFFIGIYHELLERYNAMSESEKNTEGALYREMINNIVLELNKCKDSFAIIHDGHIEEFDIHKKIVND